MGSGKADQHHRVKLMVSSTAAQYYKTYLFGIHFQQVGRMSVIESVSKLPLRWSWVHACLSVKVESKSIHLTLVQGGITYGAIEEASISSKTIDKHVIINFCDKNAWITRFRDKMIFYLYDKNAIYYEISWCIMIYHDMICSIIIKLIANIYTVLSTAFLFYQLPIFSTYSNSVLSIANIFYQ